MLTFKTTDEMADMLSAPESYNWSRLKQNVLDRAIDEINLKIEDMELELHSKKKRPKSDRS